MNLPRIVLLVLALVVGSFNSTSRAAVITAGTPITINADVPVYLTDGSYLFGITVNLGTDEFLLPVEIAGASNLQSWQFDVLFDNTVVEAVDPGDGSSGLYGAQFTAGDSSTLSFILGGFPLNGLGLVDDVAGSYPSLLAGPSGDGVLAFVLFHRLQGGDPMFRIADAAITGQVPEPSTLALLIGALLIGQGFARRFRRIGAEQHLTSSR